MVARFVAMAIATGMAHLVAESTVVAVVAAMTAATPAPAPARCDDGDGVVHLTFGAQSLHVKLAQPPMLVESRISFILRLISRPGLCSA